MREYSTLNLLKNNEISIGKWKELLTLSKFTSVFQAPEFYELFNSVHGLSAEAFAIEDTSDIKALCVVTFQRGTGIKGYFSRRAIIYGGPVLKDCKEEVIEFLIRAIAKEFKRKAIYIEIRSLCDYSAYIAIFEKNHWGYLPYQNFKIDCSNKEKLFQKLGNNRKRQIKKAISTGVEIKEAEHINEINEYYIILQRLYNEKINKPLFPKQFFEEFFNRNLGKSLLIKYKGKIIGGIICPILKEKCIYEFYICGLDEEYKEQYPSVMATWAAMGYASKNNIPVFDFMGAGKKDQDYGVREFKARFGGELVEHGRFLKLLNPFLYNLGKFGLKCLSIVK